MAPRRSAAAEEEEKPPIKFNESLSWRPGKPIPIDTLLKRLNTLSKELSETEQDEIDPTSLNKVAKELAAHQVLNHKDKGVRAYAACCIVDILRLCAPDAPFTGTQLKDFFNLVVTSIIPTLFDPGNSYNNQHKHVLRSLSEVKSIVLLLDVEGSENMMHQLFSQVFDGVSGTKSATGEHVAKDVEHSMQEMLGLLIDDAQGLPNKVVDVIIAQFLRAAAPGGAKDRHDYVPLDDNQATLLLKEEPEAYQMAKHLCQTYPDKMARFVSQYFSDVILEGTSFATGKNSNGHRESDDEDDDEDGPSGPSEADLRELRKSHVLIREIWKAAPMILQNVVPQVEAELSADNANLRQLATETLGDMISGIGAAGPPPRPNLDPAAYPPLRLSDEDGSENPRTNILSTPISAISFSQTHSVTFNNFVSRKNDKVAAIRATWATAVGYILSTSAGGIGLGRDDETALVQGLGEKLSDNDEKVRLAAVRAIESFKFQDVISKLAVNGGVNKDGSVLSTLADRCRDRKPAVRVAAMSLLSRLWAVGSGELLAGNEAVTSALSGVPSRIFNVFYANDLELNVLLDRVIYECLVPLAYPPVKKGSKKDASNGNSQLGGIPPLDTDAIRAERILLMARSLDPGAKRAFFVMQARQPQFAQIMVTFIKQCGQYNGGVMDEAADKKTANLNKTIGYLAQFLPDHVKGKGDLLRFAKINDRRNYNLIKYVIGQEHDYKTVHNAFKELIKRVHNSKDPSIMETLLPLLYRSGCIMFNRSHLSAIMEYSKTDKDGMGSVAHEVLNEISQRNPDLFKTHIGQLCKDLVDQAPTATKTNDPIVVETLKACSTYARKYPKDVPMDREFVQTMISYALYGQPARAAKYAVNILLSKKDDKSLLSATDLSQRIMKDWKYTSPNILNKLAAISQLEYYAPKVTEEADEQILNMTVQQILLEVRADTSDRDPEWVDDADMDEEIQAKCLALKILVNRLRSIEDTDEAKDKAKPVWKMLTKLVKEEGEICKTKDTPKHHKARLRLLAAQLMLKLCTQKHFDDLLTPEGFNMIALLSQDGTQEVRHGFVQTLQKYLADNRLRSRYYTIVFLLAFEPNTDFKQRTETWIRSRARHFEQTKQPVFEAIMPRLLSLLAHHPDYGQELELLIDHARYLLFYISLVATEDNLGLIYKYAERVKQTQDSLDQESVRHRVLSDLAQAVFRKWQEKRGWAFTAYSQKVGLPLGLYTALKSHSEAQAAAEKQYIPDGVDDKLDELLRAMDRKKKRKPADDRPDHQPAAKKTKLPSRPAPKEPKAPKPSAPKKAASSSKPKKPASSRAKPKKASAAESSPMPDRDRRRSGRSRTNTTYIERDSSADEEEMLEGVAEWRYSGSDSEGEPESGEEGGSNAPSEAASEPEPEPEEPTPPRSGKKNAAAPAKKIAAAATKDDDDESELSDIASAAEDQEKEEEEKEEQDDEDEEMETSPPPPTRVSRATNGRKGKVAAAPKAKPKAKAAPAKAKAAPAKSSTRPTRASARKKAASDDDEMDVDED
ncbi:putative sister chromatid cohesion protein PDS5 [Podospora aff. communis PSN243]|uniref:Sister chromatid cohesion protein PDS5 n=1 Tax=Podospora aff. communis PSN243 TaxID=3040156 RepID=A0AAV9GK58_9PEZI|nr:putative sister chromatid cohesion protein PDS5 [Podospora aff. communis PSN243]